MLPAFPAVTESVVDVTVIVPAFDAAATIVRALSSIILQLPRPRAIIVIDDGSSDATSDTARGYSGQTGDIELVVLRQSHLGPGAARNRGLAEARTKFVAFLDADDEWLAGKLAASLPAFADPDLVFAGHDMIVRDGASEIVFDCARHFPGLERGFEALFTRGFVATSTVVARRAPLLAAGGFDETLMSSQDYELWLRLAARPGERFRVVPGVFTRYHRTANSVSSRVALRRQTARVIFARHLGALRRRSATALRTALLRTAIIDHEAARAYAKAGRIWAALGAWLAIPIDLAKIALGFLRPPDTDRAAMFSGSGGNSEAGALVAAARAAENATGDPQGRNRAWWERLPMTYAPWSSARRAPETREDFRAIRSALLDASPFLSREFDFRKLAGQRVLDIGCGSGVLSCLLAETGAEVVAADITAAGTALTQRAAEALGCRLGIVQMDAEFSAIADASLDYVLAWGVLHHTRDTARSFRELTRTLRPGGGALIMVYHRASVIYYLFGLYWLVARGKLLHGYTLRTVQDFYTDGYFHRHFTRRELAALLMKSGLGVERLVVTQMNKKILPFVPSALDAWLKSRFGWLLVAEVAKPVP